MIPFPYQFNHRKTATAGGASIALALTPAQIRLLNLVLGGGVVARGTRRVTSEVLADTLSSEEGYIHNARNVLISNLMQAPAESAISNMTREYVYLAHMAQLEEALTNVLAEIYADELLKDVKKRRKAEEKE